MALSKLPEAVCACGQRVGTLRFHSWKPLSGRRRELCDQLQETILVSVQKGSTACLKIMFQNMDAVSIHDRVGELAALLFTFKSS